MYETNGATRDKREDKTGKTFPMKKFWNLTSEMDEIRQNKQKEFQENFLPSELKALQRWYNVLNLYFGKFYHILKLITAPFVSQVGVHFQSLYNNLQLEVQTPYFW